DCKRIDGPLVLRATLQRTQANVPGSGANCKVPRLLGLPQNGYHVPSGAGNTRTDSATANDVDLLSAVGCDVTGRPGHEDPCAQAHTAFNMCPARIDLGL